MGLGINDRRPRDWGYAVAFEEKELPSLEQMIKQVNQTHNTDLIEGFNQRCEERIKEGDPAVTKSEDLVTNLGLQACISLILGTSITTWQYLGIGSGSTAATVSDTTLQTVISGGRIDMSVAGRGWREAVGMKVFLGAIGNEAAIGFSAYEVGVFNASSGGTMLNRSVFVPGWTDVVHFANTYATIWSVVIEFCPVA
jgi:hypothetical protein